MKPFYQDEMGELYHADALDVMDYLKEKGIKFDLIFADPPYNIGKTKWDKFKSQEDYLNWTVKWIEKAGGILKDNGSLFTMDFSENLADVKYRVVRECSWIHSCRWLVWHYRNKPQMGEVGWTRSHESLLWLRKSKNFKFYIDRIRIPYNIHTRKYPVRPQGKSSTFGSKEGYRWDPNLKGAKPRDVIDVPAVNNPSAENVNFPTQKPEELVRKIVWATTDKGDLVFDPFGGSGTTYVVCEQLGRRWVGSEIDKDYCELAVKRIKGLKKRNDPIYWAKIDLKRVEHRRRVRGRS